MFILFPHLASKALPEYIKHIKASGSQSKFLKSKQNLLVGCFTRDDTEKFKDIDGCLDTMADGIEHNDEDEN